jgi:cytoskeletal protein CcmA (bactofilin family)
MAIVSAGVHVQGEISAREDLTIEGHVDGPVWCDGHAVIVAADGVVSGDIYARDITVFGTVTGTLAGSEVVDIRPEAAVSGRVVAERFILTEGGTFNGSAEPQHLDAAWRVARHRRPGAGHGGVATPAPRAAAPRLAT